MRIDIIADIADLANIAYDVIEDIVVNIVDIVAVTVADIIDTFIEFVNTKTKASAPVKVKYDPNEKFKYKIRYRELVNRGALGKSKNGIVSPIGIKVKTNRLGLGVDQNCIFKSRALQSKFNLSGYIESMKPEEGPPW